MHLQVESFTSGPSAVELVERKGIGNPDTICDALAEELSRALSRYYLGHEGRVLHHNVDKALLSAGASRPELGGGEMLAPIRVVLAGRATTSIAGSPVPVEALAIDSTRAWFRQTFPALDLERHLSISCQVAPGSPELVQLFERGRAPLANDTSFGVGHAPPTPLEALVLEAEARLNSEAFRRQHPEAGADVKISALRRGSKITIAVARAFIGAHLQSVSEYLAAKARTAECVQEVARERGLCVDVLVNAGDQPELDAIYLTVHGTAADGADDGQVGRGNRASGLITPHRPMSLEALAGKNPISHVGKLYNVLAQELAEDLVASLVEVRAARCFLSSQIGRPIDDPELVLVEIETYDGSPPGPLAGVIEQLVQAHLGALGLLSQRLVEGRVRLF